MTQDAFMIWLFPVSLNFTRIENENQQIKKKFKLYHCILLS
jgi:hypothetical protein